MITRKEIEETERLILFGDESEFIMLPDYSKNSKARHYREQALDYYQSIHDPQTMDAMVPYVAMNFFDRVISRLGAPPVLLNKQQNFSLFIITCYCISWKLRDNDFDVGEYLFDRKWKFAINEVKDMEKNILHALRWKAKQTLPFRFVPYFLHFLTLPRGLPVYKIIVWTQADIRFTKFRPSTVAASAILYASEKLFPDDPNDFKSVILSRYAHFDSTAKDELTECVGMVQTTYKNKMNSLVIATGLVNDGAGTSHPPNLAPDEASTVPSGSAKVSVEEGSQRHGKETVAEEANEAVTGIQTVPEQFSSPADGQESLEEGSQRQGREYSVAKEASSALGNIQTVPKQSSSPGDGRESPVKRSHRPGKEPIDEDSLYTSDDDRLCRPKKVAMEEIEEPELVAVVENLLMNFELGWDDQNPYSHGYGMCSLCDALARCWPIPITLEWLRDSWEWLDNFGVWP